MGNPEGGSPPRGGVARNRVPAQGMDGARQGLGVPEGKANRPWPPMPPQASNSMMPRPSGPPGTSPQPAAQGMMGGQAPQLPPQAAPQAVQATQGQMPQQGADVAAVLTRAGLDPARVQQIVARIGR